MPRKVNDKRKREMLAGIESRVKAGELFSTHDYEQPFKDLGYGYKEVEFIFKDFSSAFLFKAYCESFDMLPSNLQSRWNPMDARSPK